MHEKKRKNIVQNRAQTVRATRSHATPHAPCVRVRWHALWILSGTDATSRCRIGVAIVTRTECAAPVRHWRGGSGGGSSGPATAQRSAEPTRVVHRESKSALARVGARKSLPVAARSVICPKRKTQEKKKKNATDSYLRMAWHSLQRARLLGLRAAHIPHFHTAAGKRGASTEAPNLHAKRNNRTRTKQNSEGRIQIRIRARSVVDRLSPRAHARMVVQLTELFLQLSVRAAWRSLC